MVSEEDRSILVEFIAESQQLVHDAGPLVRQLVEQPGREDLLAQVTESCFRLFHSVKGTGGYLGLSHLIAPAEAMEYLLDQVRSGVMSLAPKQISLLAESCRFLEQGLNLVGHEAGDERLAVSAAALTQAILQSMQPEQSEGWTGAPADIQAGFLEAVSEPLARVEQEFVLWDFIAFDQHRVAELCRQLQRLKLSFAQYGCADMGRICTALDATLNRYLQGECFQTEYPERIFLRCMDAIRTTIDRSAISGKVKVADLDQYLANIRGLMRQPIGELLVEAGLVDPKAVDQALARQRSAREETPRRLGEVLVEMGEVTNAQIQRALQRQHHKRNRSEPGPADKTSGDLTTAVERRIPEPLPFLVAIDGRKFARLYALIRQLTDSAPQEAVDRAATIGEMHTLVRACNQEVLASFLSHSKTMIDGYASRLNKRVQLVTDNLEPLRSRPELGILTGLLSQLLRNAVEHGLEQEDRRMQAGKRKSGRLALAVLAQGAELKISVEDDGQGIEQQAIARQLLESGWATSEEVAGMSCGDCLRLLLRRQGQGASDHSQPSDRPRGLAAVNSGIRAIGGKMEVATAAGKGTRISLTLPPLS